MSNHTTTDSTVTEQRWVAFGPAGAVGSIHRTEGGFAVRLVKDGDAQTVYPTLLVAKSAIHAASGPGAEWPEFREH